MSGKEIYELAKRLYPLNRSLTGKGTRESLSILKEYVPEMQIYEVPSGTQAYDWTIPLEWNIREAYIEDAQGNRIIDFANCNLHVIGYSEPIDKYVTLDELMQYIEVEDSRPDAIPYVTSYYQRRSGFCMSKNQRNSLEEGVYHIYIDSELKQGYMSFGEIVISADEEKDSGQEIYFSTYICHPSMANNELSGPCLAVALADEIKKMKQRRYTYRFLIAPETIGAIYYLSQNLNEMKRNVAAGFVLSCVGDDRTFSYVSSRYGDTLADRVALNVLKNYYPKFNYYSFLDRASDERQYCAPGIDLPVCVVCRSKYGCYPEYHTSDDDLSLISIEGLQGSKEVYKKIIRALEYNRCYKMKCLCEPQLGKRGLYPTLSKKNSYDDVIPMMDFIAYADGKIDLIGISNRINQPIEKLIPIVDRLLKEDLIQIC